MAIRHLRINFCGVKSLLVGTRESLKGCRCGAFVEIYCAACLIYVYVKFSSGSLDGGVKLVAEYSWALWGDCTLSITLSRTLFLFLSPCGGPLLHAHYKWAIQGSIWLILPYDHYRSQTMGGRKFRLSCRKNEERKRQWKKTDSLLVFSPRELVTLKSFRLSFPVSVYTEGHVSSLESLSSRLASLPLPESWKIASMNPLTLRVQPEALETARFVEMMDKFSEPETMPDPAWELLWLPAPTWWSARQPQCSGICEKYTSAEGDQLLL